MSFRILFVCTGNVCRSPMAELLFRTWADPASGVTVSSAGMAALVGEGVDRSSAEALRQAGIEPDDHVARQFRPGMAARADLVLTAEAGHRNTIMEQVPSTFRRVFTMKEFARLARHATATVPTVPADVVAELARKRGLDGPVPADQDDMPDPFRGSVGQASAVALQVGAAVRATVDVLGFARPEPAPVPEPVLVTTATPRRPSPRPRPRPLPR